MLPYKRATRVADLIKEEVADIILKRIKDPRIGFITVTDVELTSDMKMARVFVSVYTQPVESEPVVKPNHQPADTSGEEEFNASRKQAVKDEPSEAELESLEILSGAAKFVRLELSRRVKLKNIPSIEFKLDSTVKRGDRIERLLRGLREDM